MAVVGDFDSSVVKTETVSLSSTPEETKGHDGKVETPAHPHKEEKEKSPLATFKALIRGRVLLPNEEGFADARETFNQEFLRTPALIVQPKSAADITHSLTYANEQKLKITVKCGGHSFTGKSSGDGVLLLDMKQYMNWVNVNVEEKTAWIGGGCLLGDIDRETSTYGLITPLGTYPYTGIGLALHGGVGFLSALHGLSVDNILEVDIVTADGKLLHCTKDGPYSDLWWGVRGAASHYGVVTQFKTQLYPYPKKVWGGMVFWDASHFKALLKFHTSKLHLFPREFDGVIVRTMAPPFLGAKPVVIFVFSYMGSEEKGKEIAEQYKAVATPLLDTTRSMDYVTELQHLLDHLSPPKPKFYESPRLFADNILSDETVNAVGDALEKSPPGVTYVMVDFHGASEDKPHDFNAYSTRGYRYQGAFVVMTPSNLDSKQEEQRLENIKWVKQTRESLTKHFAQAVYHNNLTDDTDTTIKKGTWGKNLERVQTLKAKYDPTNVFIPITDY